MLEFLELITQNYGHGDHGYYRRRVSTVILLVQIIIKCTRAITRRWPVCYPLYIYPIYLKIKKLFGQ